MQLRQSETQLTATVASGNEEIAHFKSQVQRLEQELAKAKAETKEVQEIQGELLMKAQKEVQRLERAQKRAISAAEENQKQLELAQRQTQAERALATMKVPRCYTYYCNMTISHLNGYLNALL